MQARKPANLSKICKTYRYMKNVQVDHYASINTWTFHLYLYLTSMWSLLYCVGHSHYHIVQLRLFSWIFLLSDVEQHSPTYDPELASGNFSPFAAVSLCGVAGPAETFPSFPVSGPFLHDVPGFQAPPDSIFRPQLRSFSRPPIFISTTARMVSVSSLLLTCPNHSSLLLLINIAIGSTFASSKISSFLRCSNRPIAHRTIPISVVAIRFSSLTDIGHVSQP